jgi:hypothetical protein
MGTLGRDEDLIRQHEVRRRWRCRLTLKFFVWVWRGEGMGKSFLRNVNYLACVTFGDQKEMMFNHAAAARMHISDRQDVSISGA